MRDGGPTIIDEVDLEATGDNLDRLALAMYKNAVRLGMWQPAAVDLSRDKPKVEALDGRRRAYLERFAAAFYNAEENVARIFGRWVMAAPTTWMQVLTRGATWASPCECSATRRAATRATPPASARSWRSTCR